MGGAANYQRVRTNQAMDTLMEYTCLSISPAFPQVGGKPDHVSSQGKEAVFAMHDIYGELLLTLLLSFMGFWLIWFINQRALYNHELSIIIGIGIICAYLPLAQG